MLKNDTSQPTDAQVEQEKLEQDFMMDTGSVIRTKGRHAIHCLTVIGLIDELGGLGDALNYLYCQIEANRTGTGGGEGARQGESVR